MVTSIMAKGKIKNRKPDFDEKEIPKVLKGPVEPPTEDKPKSESFGQPLRARPDYDEGQAAMMKDIPLNINGVGVGTQGPSSNLDIESDKPGVLQDYDEPECGPSCPCQGDQGGITEEVAIEPGDGQGMVMVLICPDCGAEGPFNMTPPTGIPMEDRQLKCAKCQAKVPFKGIIKLASGKYVIAGRDDVKSLISHIKGYLKVGSILTWDIIHDIEISLDTLCKKFDGAKKDKD